MPRRLNYTDRRKIKRSDISIRLYRGSQGLAFDAYLHFADYRLDKVTPPPEVYVEAYRGASALWKRFSFGYFGAIQAPNDRSLEEFGVPEGILFRVKVSSTTDDALGRLLAEADAIRPRLPDEQDGHREPLIRHMRADDIGDELWRIEFVDDMPLLKINSRAPMGVDQFLRDPLHRAIIMPAVMREILSRILILDRDGYDDEDTTCWQLRWLDFALRLPGIGETPSADEENGKLQNADELEEWIDDAVEAFTSYSGLFAAFSNVVAPESPT